MRILAPRLLQDLQQNLQCLYFVCGHEPLQHQESLSHLRLAAKKAGYSERERYNIESDTDWDSFIISLKTASLFSEKRLIELHLPEKLNTTLDNQVNRLLDFIPVPNSIVIISHTYSDRKIEATAWFKAIDTKGVIITCRPLTRSQTRTWLENRLKMAGYNSDPAIIETLLEKTEGHLLAAQQAIEKISLYGHAELTLEKLEAIVPQNAKFRVFDLVDAALAGNAKRILHILKHLHAEGEVEPYLIIWAIQQTLQKTTSQGQMSVTKIIVELQAIDEIIKGRRIGNAWHALTRLLLQLTAADFLDTSLLYPFGGPV